MPIHAGHQLGGIGLEFFLVLAMVKYLPGFVGTLLWLALSQLHGSRCIVLHLLDYYH